MPTDKNKVSAYLSDEDFDLLGAFAGSQRVSKSTAISLAIRQVMGVGSLPYPLESNGTKEAVSNPTIEALGEDRIKALMVEVLADIPTKVEQSEGAIAALESQVKGHQEWLERVSAQVCDKQKEVNPWSDIDEATARGEWTDGVDDQEAGEDNGIAKPLKSSQKKGLTDKEVIEVLKDQGLVKPPTPRTLQNWRDKGKPNKPSPFCTALFEQFTIDGKHWYPKN